MENEDRVGNIIKNARGEKNISIEFISEKTKISKKFITSIENSDFSNFPADIYLYGFIYNICEALDLEAKKLVDQFKKEQEINQYHTKYSPTLNNLDGKPNIADVENLASTESNYEKHSSRLRKKWIIPLGVILLLSVLIFWLYRLTNRVSVIPVISPDNVKVEAKIYKMHNEKSSFDFRLGDTIKIFINETANIFTLLNISGENAVFTINNQEYTVGQGDSVYIDLNNDKINDIEIKLKIISDDVAIFLFNIINYNDDQIDFTAIWNQQDHIIISEEDFTLFSRQDKFPIVVYIKALSQPSFLGYNIDGKRQDSKTLSPGEETLIKADEHLEIQIGNYRSDILIINKHPITITSQSDSFQTTKIIKWVPDPENETKFDLVIKDSYN